ncbi:response regulator [Azospira restricta]|uniref:Response regulator n=1 Tax=Azospira restricta TaxID=404405 RepID=A0A974PVI6_9RHOO|nr:response regulator [Azospira restricta]QRJ62293.1 response regulator [Azospira restricta]
MRQGATHRHPAQIGGTLRPHYWAGTDLGDDLIAVIEDLADDDADCRSDTPWRVLIADDDHSVHEATVAALAGQRIEDRPLSFLHAYSARETISLLAAGDPVHLVLLDVVMESPDAGLHAVNDIRENLGLRDLKIVIRTGQPGLASEQDIRDRYAIDGYANKAELTRSMLREVIAAALGPGSATLEGA